MRWLIATACATALLGSAASAQPPNKEQAQRQAYDHALTCFVANAHAANERKRAGDTDKAAIYLANAKRSFDGAVAMGRAMGLSNRTMNGDLDAASARDLGRFMADREAFLAAASTCKALGLM
ncbi:MAG: hypothetical protein QM608_02960 [Caulobacter sp.]